MFGVSPFWEDIENQVLRDSQYDIFKADTAKAQTCATALCAGCCTAQNWLPDSSSTTKIMNVLA